MWSNLEKSTLNDSPVIFSSFCYLLRSRLRLHEGKVIKDRRHHLRTYPNCFVAKELIDWLIEHKEASDRDMAIKIMQKLLDQSIIHHGKSCLCACAYIKCVEVVTYVLEMCFLFLVMAGFSLPFCSSPSFFLSILTFSGNNQCLSVDDSPCLIVNLAPAVG